MKTLEFLYDMKIQFSEPVINHSFTVKCTAGSDARQRILRQDIRILPKKFLSEDVDSFGNRYFFGRTDDPHCLFQVTSRGIARTGLAQSIPVEPNCGRGLYLVQTPCTAPGRHLKEFYSSFSFSQTSDDLEKSFQIMETVWNSFSYQSGSTEIGTTAEEAFLQGTGVCQDYAHIMISLCRMAKIPCRYVVGMLLGEGESHAWVEVLFMDRWFGLDPTNHIAVKDDHIKISHGRDYKDCLINQGVFTGNARQTRSISVQVTEKRGVET